MFVAFGPIACITWTRPATPLCVALEIIGEFSSAEDAILVIDKAHIMRLNAPGGRGALL